MAPCGGQRLHLSSVLTLQLWLEELNFILCERKSKATKILCAGSSLTRVAVKDKSATHVPSSGSHHLLPVFFT